MQQRVELGHVAPVGPASPSVRTELVGKRPSEFERPTQRAGGSDEEVR